MGLGFRSITIERNTAVFTQTANNQAGRGDLFSRQADPLKAQLSGETEISRWDLISGASFSFNEALSDQDPGVDDSAFQPFST